MKYTWEEDDITPGIVVREKLGYTNQRYGENEKLVAVGVGGGGMYQFGLLKESANFVSKPMYKTEMVQLLNEKFYEPVSG
jgi:hypothetical protein